jgi:hypothetical protein
MTERRPIWPLGALALALAIAGVVLLLVQGPDALGLPFDDLRLDDQRSTATAVVTAREPHGTDLVRYRYAFTDHEDTRREGASWGTGPAALADGAECVVEFLADDPDTNRLQGTRRSRSDPAVLLPLGLLLLPAVFLALLWLRGVARRRLAAAEPG